ncbi:hypothetical protein DSO57_1019148 [Entomophthora muscae]|uniref:Uncharacterized protein n=1 Tax=Entomophthora muscae TaxID=34485 RepID=A0ACC2RVA2_9FUNG|nr:hypothetical protein DSO57_1019148 [Entomophthora muscae]
MALFCSNSARALLSSTRRTKQYHLGMPKRDNASSSHTPRSTLSLYGPHWHGLTTGPRPRHAVVSLYCATFDLVHTKPIWFCPRNDHVYARTQLSVAYSAEPAVIASDHHCLLVEIALSHTTDAAPAFGLERYHLRRLDNPRVSALLRGAFGVIAPLLIDTLSMATHSIASLSAPGRQCLVDGLDAQLRTRPSDASNTVQTLLQDCRVYRPRLKRPKHRGHRRRSLSTLRAVFAQPDSSLRGVSAAVQQCHSAPCPEIVEFFSADNVCKYIKRYSSTVSCGSDSIHGRILKRPAPS